MHKVFCTCDQEASCTVAEWGGTGAKEGLGGVKDSWETFAPRAQRSQKDLLHPPLTTFGDVPFLGNFPSPQHPKTFTLLLRENPAFLSKDSLLQTRIRWKISRGWGGGQIRILILQVLIGH